MPNNSTPDYRDLDITIGVRNGDEYPVRAYSTTCGESHGVLRFPYSDHEEFKVRVGLVYSTLRDMRRGREYFREGKQIIDLFGKELFDALFTGNIHTLYRICVQETKGMKKLTGLRLRLHIADAELATVPWEYLYDEEIRNYVSLYHILPVVRYMDLRQPTIAPRVKLPLNILCMISSPTDLAPLNVQREKKLMQDALEPLIKSSLVKVEWLEQGKSYRDLQGLMRDKIWHIFHFIGHGGFDPHVGESFLCFCGELEESYKIYASHLTPLLALQQKTLKLVFLNTCEGAKAGEKDMFSSLVGGFMANGVLSVIAMQQQITDRGAIVFSENFYSSIAHFMPIDASVSIARTAMNGQAKKTMEWGVPALYMRAGNGVLFQKVPIPQRTASQSTHTMRKKKTNTDQTPRTIARKRRATNRQSSVQTLRETAYTANPYDYKRSSLKTSKSSVLDETQDFLAEILLQTFDFFRHSLSRKKFTKRYRKNLLGFFFFLISDVIFISMGIYNWLHLPLVTAIIGFIALAAFIFNSLSEDIIACIAVSLLFGGADFALGMFYTHQLGFIVIMLISILLSFLRAQFFRPA